MAPTGVIPSVIAESSSGVPRATTRIGPPGTTTGPVAAVTVVLGVAGATGLPEGAAVGPSLCAAPVRTVYPVQAVRAVPPASPPRVARTARRVGWWGIGFLPGSGSGPEYGGSARPS
ncbi:hypothetical protein [Kitasatospora paranensis]|uniref:hypothetical protein n=1 Tax=Kitasatospora paranensis TaxID=258053 RepID=UPI0031E7B016